MKKTAPIHSHYYTVTFTTPELTKWGDKEEIRAVNHYDGVIANTLEEAIDKVRAAYPDATLTSARNSGNVTIL